jgi:hypothetical protein
MESPPYRLLDSWREQEARNEAGGSPPQGSRHGSGDEGRKIAVRLDRGVPINRTAERARGSCLPA